MISNSSFQLKGSGWYLSDYARKGEKSSSAPKETEAKPAEKASDKTGPSSKAETKTKE